MPEIPNTRFLNKTAKLDVFEYVCQAGHVLLDLTTRTPITNGTLSCVSGYWMPYPFFACLHLTEITYYSNKELTSTQPQNGNELFPPDSFCNNSGCLMITDSWSSFIFAIGFGVVLLFILILLFLLAYLKRDSLLQLIERLPRKKYAPANPQ